MILQVDFRKRGGFLSFPGFFCLIVLVHLFAVPSAQAQEHCPWLNAATAGAALEANVTVTVSVSHPDDKSTVGVCDFIRKQGSDLWQIRITVETMPDPAASFSTYLSRCGVQAKPLKTIGNEAVVCDMPEKGVIVEQVIGRVRDQAFIVLMRSGDKSVSESALRDRIDRVAEQVAGNLF